MLVYKGNIYFPSVLMIRWCFSVVFSWRRSGSIKRIDRHFSELELPVL